MKLRFENAAQDKAPREVSSDWFQITYADIIRNADDEEIATFRQGYWIFEGDTYSDIVIFVED